ncbi:MAG: hypothetical protein ACTSQG_00035 [Promethearchaeota archaeon]
MNKKEQVIKMIKTKDYSNVASLMEKLEGSEKQIKWAEKIRAEYVENSIDELKYDFENEYTIEELEEDIIDFLGNLNEKDSSMFITSYTS